MVTNLMQVGRAAAGAAAGARSQERSFVVPFVCVTILQVWNCGLLYIHGFTKGQSTM